MAWRLSFRGKGEPEYTVAPSSVQRAPPCTSANGTADREPQASRAPSRKLNGSNSREAAAMDSPGPLSSTPMQIRSGPCSSADNAHGTSSLDRRKPRRKHSTAVADHDLKLWTIAQHDAVGISDTLKAMPSARPGRTKGAAARRQQIGGDRSAQDAWCRRERSRAAAGSPRRRAPIRRPSAVSHLEAVAGVAVRAGLRTPTIG